ncbi:putative uncharacterized protein [Acetobacter sp. CAG:977]|nr:putative uncharacterized protein [Acetobacter sp. CAG:977]
MCKWLEIYLKDKYKKQDCEILVLDCHSEYLDSVLEKNSVITYFPHIVGLKIQIDILGIVKLRGKSEIIFIEAKKKPLNLHDLGQLWAYCKLCDPSEAFLLSPEGMGSLDKVLKNLNREDMLNYGDGKRIKKMIVAKWDISKNSIDYDSTIPKL